jgi:hypothetical protein
MFHRLMLVLALSVPILSQPQPKAPAPSKKPAPPATSFAISGRVVNLLDGQPLAKTEVFIRPSEHQDELQHTITAEDGSFRFDNLAKGKYGLSARRHGFSEQSYRQHEFFSTAIAVGPGQLSEDLTFPLAPDASISGTVTDEQNEAVPGGAVQLFRSGVEGGVEAVRMQDQTTLDDEGHYRFSHLSPGKYYVVVSARPWYSQYVSQPAVSFSGDGTEPESAPAAAVPADIDVAYPTTYYAGASDPDQASAIDLQPGSRATADVTLTPVPGLHLRVRTGSGSTNAGVNFTQRVFDRFDANVQASVNQRTPGLLEVTGLPPGRFVMNVSSFDGKQWVNRNQILDVASDAEIDATESRSSPVVINGSLQIAGSSPSHQAYIRFLNRETGDAFGDRVTSQGEFHLEHDLMTPGSYQVVVFNVPDHVVAGLSASGAKTIGHTLQLAGGESVRLSVLLTNGLGRIDGTVMDGDKPVSEAMVVLVPQDLEHNLTLVRRDQSDSDGTFTLREVVPGRYTVIAVENGWGLRWADPTVLKPFLAHGETANINGGSRYSVKVCLQSVAAGCK